MMKLLEQKARINFRPNKCLILFVLLTIYNSNHNYSAPIIIQNGSILNKGQCFGILYTLNSKDEKIMFDFQCQKVQKKIISDKNLEYASSYTEYITQTTSNKTTLKYVTYASANAISLIINGVEYQKSTTDGASDIMIDGVSSTSVIENNTEYLNIIFEKDIVLDNRQSLFKNNPSFQADNYDEWKDKIKQLKVLKNSALIMTILL